MLLVTLVVATGVEITWEIDTDEQGLMGITVIGKTLWMTLNSK